MDKFSKLPASTSSDIRISTDISNHEKQNVEARKCTVKTCLHKFNIECPMGNVPNIAVLGSGGGLRALIALQGTLGELQKQDLLDAVMYLCGVSGSTWCMSYIYEKEEWGKHLPSLEDKLYHKLVNPEWEWKKTLESLVESSKDDTYSLTDFWGYVIVYIMMHDLDDHHLSDEQKICNNGLVPYPIYAAVDATKLDAAANKFHSDIWFEFTPHEGGFFNPGLFVDVIHLGSKFEDGKLKEKKNEKKMSYLRDILKRLIFHYFHSLAPDKGPSETYNFCCTLKKIEYSLDLIENGKHFLKLVENLELEFTAEKKGIVNHKEITIADELKMNAEKSTVQESSCEFYVQNLGYDIWDIMKFIKKTFICIIEWKWGNISNYAYRCIDVKEKEMTDKKDIQLADAGIAINSAYPLILHPERKVDLILSFDFSEGDPFETIKKASQYCKENNLAFPEIDAVNLDKVKDNPEDCYIFKGNGCPTVMHFPLFNRVNCGDNILDWRNRYKTFTLSYPDQDIKNLLKAAKTNVQKNAKRILQMLKAVANP
ncbi:cytosolic phospholipase A2 gamma-like isoform X2 [Erythrolamprus reginae]|uniref:cytosolic phospholipase A2 gamma-like isoform X2 n=1 Tax=Erythrolamprus reginae TaxID=121349 RepID=UPI00396C3B31